MAAGLGTRLRPRSGDVPKPLVPVAGVPLVKRALLAMAEAGLSRVVVVVGYKADEVRAHIARDGDYARAGLRSVDFVMNDEYEKSLGISVSKVEGHVHAPFVLAMSDHVFATDLVRLAAAADMTRADLYLCVDRRIHEIDDPDDATRVLDDGERILNIDKGIGEYNAIDCGVFAMTPAIFTALREARVDRPQPSLSDGVKRLAARGRARIIDIGNAFWQDVDAPPSLDLAEQKLAALAAEARSPRGVHG